jgi:DNA-binding transcriptional LysR family regulator
MFDLNQLSLLQAVDRTGSYSAAARELGCTQPAVTYQMRSLERQVGAPIAVRVGRTMRLTPTGDALLAHANRITALLRAAEHDMTALVGQQTGIVRLAAFPSSCATLVPEAIVAMSRALPSVDVRLVQAEPPQARDLVRRGEADLALCYRFAASAFHRPDPVRSTGPLERIRLLTEEVSLVLPADHPAAHHKLIGIEQLADDTFVIASDRFQDALLRAASAAGFVPKITMVADDYVAMQALVGHGLGIALIPALALAAHRDERTVARSLRGWPRRHVDIELWPDLLRVHAVRTLADLLKTGAAHRP